MLLICYKNVYTFYVVKIHKVTIKKEVITDLKTA